jgi:hypothetical protein
MLDSPAAIAKSTADSTGWRRRRARAGGNISPPPSGQTRVRRIIRWNEPVAPRRGRSGSVPVLTASSRVDQTPPRRLLRTTSSTPPGLPACSRIVGALVGALANMAWNVATFLVVPVTRARGARAEGRPQALARRGARAPGRGRGGTFAIGGLVFLLAFLPGVVLFAAGIAISSSVAFLGAALVVIGIAVFVIGPGADRTDGDLQGRALALRHRGPRARPLLPRRARAGVHPAPPRDRA